jgi:hypothetical protein
VEGVAEAVSDQEPPDELAQCRVRGDTKARLAELWREIAADRAEFPNAISCTVEGCTERLEMMEGMKVVVSAGDEVGYLGRWRFDLVNDARLCPDHAEVGNLG